MSRRPLAIAVALAMALAGCDGNGKVHAEDETLRSDPTVVFAQATSASLLDGATAVVMSIILKSTARRIRITHVEPVAEPGLVATYLGYSYCKRGCPGAGPWNADMQERASRGRDGMTPLDIPLDGEFSRPSIMLLLEPRGDGLTAVQSRCLLVTGLKLTLDDGRRLLATFDGGGPIAGVQVPDRGPDYQTCRQRLD